jgi:predicted PurR-regulated permease PerM
MPQVRDLHVLYRAVLLAFALLALGLLFHELVSLLVAVLITILIAIPISIAADRLERYRIPRAIGALLALLAGLGVLAGVLALVIPPFIDQTQEFVDRVPTVIEDLEGEISDVSGAERSDVASETQQFLEGYVDDPDRLISPLASIGLSIAGILGALIVIMLTAYYIAIRPDPLIRGITALFPPARREWAEGVMRRLRDSWVGWMQGVVLDMLITGVLLYIGLSLIGIEFAIVFAIFSAVLVLIPYFGAIAGAIPPVLFALTDSPGKALLALAIYVGVQQVESNLTVPLIMAQRVKLHPAIVAVGVLVVAQLFGFVGLFVAVPILSAIVILTDELWVKPMEARQGVRAATEVEIEGPLPDAERGPPKGEETEPTERLEIGRR